MYYIYIYIHICIHIYIYIYIHHIMYSLVPRLIKHPLNRGIAVPVADSQDKSRVVRNARAHGASGWTALAP